MKTMKKELEGEITLMLASLENKSFDTEQRGNKPAEYEFRNILFFFFFKLYNIVLVLPNMEMNPRSILVIGLKCHAKKREI